MKILVADDDPVSCSILSRALSSLGHQPVLARDGEEAWRTFASQPIECVVTDWLMPGLAGPDLCRRIRASAERPWAFVLLLTGKDRKEDLVEGILAGADEFMTKPLDLDVLRARLHTAERVLGLEHALKSRIRDLEATLAEVKTLRGLISICMYCKQVRNGPDVWEKIEAYICDHSDAKFSHGICPSCYEQHVQSELDGLQTRPARAARR
jgi:DNA-binding response OmpR family regulator